MIFKLYLFLLGILFCSFGIYQFLVGKPTILSKNLLRKYNLNEHFIKIHGMLYIIVGFSGFLIVPHAPSFLLH